ncbi:MAG: hypothetical protein HN383_16450 [Verrucomicrobia bacterium]|nr:hypothetical protein [Verrucomicrobiota bacterium]MBT7702041.1 hypothetical protein [Verrucomicrobiota bacterium]
MDLWLPGYLASLRRRPRHTGGTRHLMVALCDHYEPYRGGVDDAAARAHVARWTTAYPAMAEPFRDSDGGMPRHTFFYPAEEYDPTCLDALGDLMRQGCGEVEIHLHHRHDTPEGLRDKLVRFRDLLHTQHGMLGKINHGLHGWSRMAPDGAGERDAINHGGDGDTLRVVNSPADDEHPSPSVSSVVNSPAFAFIHGNWSLCNSRPDGDWCGVNEELSILAETGCYADLTFPSAPSPTQPRTVNSIYRAHDNPNGRGHDHGTRLRVTSSGCDQQPADNVAGIEGGGIPPTQSPQHFPDLRPSASSAGSHLLLIQGPLALNFARRKYGLLPRIENAEISAVNPPTPDRIRLWERTAVHVEGRPEWIFVKLHTHGCVPANSEALLGDPIRQMHRTLQTHYNDGRNWQLHYVTAREMTNIILAAEQGCSGDPGKYRDYRIGQPAAMR